MRRYAHFAKTIAFLAAVAARPVAGQSQPPSTQPAPQQDVQQDEPEANPARPTVSNPATLIPVGYLQFETGTLGATDSPEFRHAMNSTKS